MNEVKSCGTVLAWMLAAISSSAAVRSRSAATPASCAR